MTTNGQILNEIRIIRKEQVEQGKGIARVEQWSKDHGELHEEIDKRQSSMAKRDYMVMGFSIMTASIAGFFGIQK